MSSLKMNHINEYRTYVKNKHIKDMTYVAADNIRIYQFLEEIESLPLRQPIAPFQTSRDITDYLKEQWAGLFQRLLQESSKQTEVQAIQDIKTTANTHLKNS